MGVAEDMYGDDLLEHNLIYRGVVEDVDDPEKAGRIKVRIMGIHSDNPKYVETSHLPWAIPASSLSISGGGLRNIGTYNIPSIGSHVFLFFEAGDHNFPVYFSAAPAIEDVEDYQEKDGKSKDGSYEYLEKSQYDDKTDHSDKLDMYETPNDENISHPVQDWAAQTRKNTFGEGGSASIPPPKKDSLDASPIFPSDFFIKSVRVAFDGAANHDAAGYDGRHTTKPSTSLTNTELQQELDAWDERKWGHNDDDKNHQHDFSGGGDWKPEYPMVNTERNAQGEILDTDVLKERRVFIHPSKYFVELIQLDSSRQKTDFLNERSVKKVYERQRGVANSPDVQWSKPKKVDISGESNQSKAIQSSDSDLQRRVSNEFTYDDIDGSTRQQRHARFEERKHNPGREKTIIEDFVYRFFMSLVNETYQVDRNTRFYVGNDNIEIEHGDRNYRLHRGSHNQHIDEGNFNRVVNRGWEHLHIDEGHHFIEICGSGSGSDGGAYNSFDISSSHEPEGNPDHCDNQHGPDDVRGNHPKSTETLASKMGCDAKFAAWSWDGENDCGNQFFLFHKGSQIFRLVEGHQHFHLLKGHQKFHLVDGHQTFHLQNGDQRWQLDQGDMERYANGHRYSIFTKSCIEDSQDFWRFKASNWFKIKAPVIVLDGDVRVTGDVQIDGNVKCEVILSPGSPNMHVAAALQAASAPPGPGVCKPPSASVSVPFKQAVNPLTPGQCPG